MARSNLAPGANAITLRQIAAATVTTDLVNTAFSL
jgi:hypothetical protein